VFIFAPLQQRLALYLSPSEIKDVARAYLFAADAHENQLRSSGEVYVTHTVAAACILAEMHLDAQTIMAALLHDVLEDTAVTRHELNKKFGAKVTELVEGVSKLTKIHFESKQEAQAENFRKMMLAMTEDIRVILIKMADRLHNMSTIQSLPPEKRRRIARETLEIYAPLAHRLGLNNIKIMLEDLSFKALYPWRYQILKEAVCTAKGHRQKLFEKLEKALALGLEKFSIMHDHVFGRTKSLYSVYSKMKDRGVPFAEIMDIYGFRIIARDIFDCYHVLGAVHSIFKPIPGKFKDYIAIPKANGYQSLHTILFGPFGVPIEIQIRTETMDRIAENGIASHWIYKTPEENNRIGVQALNWLKKVADMQASSGTSLDFIRDMKVDLFPDEVYVFTPKGEILCLPRGASALDYAYAVHTEVGNHCKEILVNKYGVPLSYPLLNGQTVEITTSPDIHPDTSWLTMVVTGRAKSAIRHALKDLNEHADKKGDAKEPITRKRKKPIFVIHSSKGLNLDLARCCHPIPGDSIKAVMTPAHKVVVHVSDCQHLADLVKKKNHGKWVEVTWSQQISGFFPVKVRVDAHNNVGVIAGITREIAELGGNIREFLMHEPLTEQIHIDMIVEVLDRAHLAKIIRHIRRLTFVKKVARVLH
jgi:GTP diphosphokinase / guanosine-3',5'-bis(diphosphate) 3'-diphosphatase